MCKIKNSYTIHFAPLQGVTDKVYRSVFNALINNVDYYYSPYISLENTGAIKMQEDIVGLNENIKSKTIPQILPASLSELKVLVKPVIKQDFQTLNINMGCPYPMVTRKGRGAALILKPELTTDLINYINDYTNLKVSLKIRSGIDNSDQIFTLLDHIPIEKVKNIIVHPRVATQLYKGEADIAIFKKCCMLFPEIQFIYNGDIKNYSDFIDKKDFIKDQKEWMIGRGLIENPFLAWQIKNMNPYLPNNFELKLQEFSLFLIESIKIDSKDKSHALNRIKHQFNLMFKGNEKYKRHAKRIKKSNNIDELVELIKEFKY